MKGLSIILVLLSANLKSSSQTPINTFFANQKEILLEDTVRLLQIRSGWSNNEISRLGNVYDFIGKAVWPMRRMNFHTYGVAHSSNHKKDHYKNLFWMIGFGGSMQSKHFKISTNATFSQSTKYLNQITTGLQWDEYSGFSPELEHGERVIDWTHHQNYFHHSIWLQFKYGILLGHTIGKSQNDIHHFYQFGYQTPIKNGALQLIQFLTGVTANGEYYLNLYGQFKQMPRIQNSYISFKFTMSSNSFLQLQPEWNYKNVSMGFLSSYHIILKTKFNQISCKIHLPMKRKNSSVSTAETFRDFALNSTRRKNEKATEQNEEETSNELNMTPVSQEWRNTHETYLDDYTGLEYIFFSKNSSTIASDVETQLQQLLLELKKFKRSPIVITGHSDSIGSETEKVNIACERMQVVEEYLVRNGINKKRLISDCYSDMFPFPYKKFEEDNVQDRRVEIKYFKWKDL